MVFKLLHRFLRQTRSRAKKPTRRKVPLQLELLEHRWLMSGGNLEAVATSFKPTASGFSLQFNQPLDVSVLNLYDAQSGGLGQADLTLTQVGVGPVQGSLVVAPSGDRITFVRTGDVLPPGSYTVNLRSGAAGFRSTMGGLLDGNRDGTPGDNFVASFTVASSTAPTLRVLDFARGPGQPVDVPATSFGLPIRLSEASGVRTATFSLLYNPALLSITGASAGPLGATVTLDTSAPGVAVLSFISLSPLAAGPVDLVNLTAQVPGSAPYGAQHVLDLVNVQINGGAIAARDDDGVHVVSFLGEATGNQSYSGLDAQRTLRVGIGLDSGFAAFPRTDPVIVADITGNGAISSQDAMGISKKVVGLDPPAIPPLPTLPTPGSPMVSITAADATASEPGADTGFFTISRTGSTAAPLLVSFFVSGSATNGVDYSAIGTSVTIPIGALSVNVPVNPLNDTAEEGTEFVTLTLNSSSSYLVSTPGSATINIIDDDLATVTIQATDPNAEEVNALGTGPDPGVFTLTRTGSTANSLFVNFTLTGTATVGGDYSRSPPFNSAFFLPGQNTTTIVITPFSDYLLEANETVIATLTAGSGYVIGMPGSATVTIFEDPRGRVQNRDPEAGAALLATGNFQTTHTLDLDRSPGTCACFCREAALVYNSDSVSVRPILQTSVQTYTGQPLPTAIIVQLTWNGMAQAPVSFSTSGFTAGQVLTAAVQVGSPVLASGRHAWSMQVTLDFPTGTDPVFNLSGSTFVVTQDSSAFGAGWTFSMIDRLLSIPVGPSGPAGMLRIFGTGGWRFYQQTGPSTFQSPSEDPGTLTNNGPAGFTYATPDGIKRIFNGSGNQTTLISPDNNEQMTFAYDASNRLVSFTAIDGAVSTFSYSAPAPGGRLSSVSLPGRVYTMTPDTFGNLTSIRNPDDAPGHNALRTFTYGASPALHQLAGDNFAGFPTSVAYRPSGTVQQITRGSGPLSSTTPVMPSVEHGLNPALPINGLRSGQPQAVQSDPRNPSLSTWNTLWTLDDRGRPVQMQQPTVIGGSWTWERDSHGWPTAQTDPLGRRTTYIYDQTTGYVTRETLPDFSARTYTYTNVSPFGDPVRRIRMTRSTDELGRVTDYAYNPQGHLLRETNAQGQTTVYTYTPTGMPTPPGLLESVTNARGFVTRYFYDSARRLERVVEAVGTPQERTTRTIYDGLGNATSVTDPRGFVSQTIYDPVGQPLTITEAVGTPEQRATTYVHDGMGHLTDVTDALGRVTRHVYDNLGRHTQMTEAVGLPLQRTTTYGYDAADNMNQVTDPRGFITQFTYDALNRQTQMVEAVGVTGLTRTTTYSYDLVGNLRTKIEALGKPEQRQTLHSYDSRNRRTETTEALGKPEERTTLYTYDRADNLISVTDPRDVTTQIFYDALDRQIQRIEAVDTSEQRLIQSAYDPEGNVVESTDALGRRTLHNYDALNRETSRIEAFGTPDQRSMSFTYDANDNVTRTVDPLGHIADSVYDALNRHTSMTEAVGTPEQRMTQYRYNAVDRVTRVIDPLNHITDSVYDAHNRRTSMTEAVGTPEQRTITYGHDLNDNVLRVTNALNHVTQYSYDGLNRPTAVTDPLNHTTTMVYDANDNVVQTIDPLNFRINYTYGALDRQLTMQYPSTGTFTTIYDAVGNVLRTTDPLNHSTNYEYDALNRLRRTIDARTGTTQYTYDAVGNQTSVTDPVSNQTTFEYDNLNREVRRNDPLNHSAVFTYDSNGNLTATTDRLGRRRTFIYDALDRVTTETWLPPSGSTAVNTLTYQYDANNNLLRAADSHGVYVKTYDALDRVRTVQEPFGVNLTYGYDADDRRTQVQDSLGGVTSSIYDEADRLTRRTFGGTGQTPLRIDLTHTHRDQLETVTRYSNLAGTMLVGSSAYTYDGTRRMTDLVHRNSGGTALATYVYGYDLANRLTSETINGTPRTYTYNETDELTGDGPRSFSYDLNGNRTNTGSVTGPNNRLTTNGTWNYTYDNEGNLIRKVRISDGQVWTYTYDHRNQMTSAEQRNASGAQLQHLDFTYDVFGNRIEKLVIIGPSGSPTSSVERYAYDGDHIWADLNGNNQLQMRRLYRDEVDQVFARISSTGVAAWYLPDHLGSIRDVTNAAGAVQDHLDYDGFGNVLSETSPSFGDRYKYTGREFDSETGLQYNRARYYDPTIGRWASEDPLGFDAGDGNLYRYVKNGPTLRIDPTGRESKTEWQKKAYAEIGLTGPNPPRDVWDLNKRITAAYAKMYLRNPQAFKWAGMAALASQEVGYAMSSIRDVYTTCDDLTRGLMEIFGPASPLAAFNMLKIGNWAVFDDIYWQHLAYAEKGFAEIERLHKAGEIEKQAHDAWKLIAEGEKKIKEGKHKEGNEDIWKGSEMLLEYEQKVTLQTGVYDRFKRESSWLSDQVTAPMYLGGMCKSFKKFFEGKGRKGNFGNADDRWEWIKEDMLPAWRRMVENSPRLVEGFMKEFIRKAAK